MKPFSETKRFRKRDRLSLRQARWAVAVALILGLGFSLTQLVIDFNSELDRLDHTTLQFLEILDQPSSFAAYRRDKMLSKELVVGYFAFGPTYEAMILDDQGAELAKVTGNLNHGPYRAWVDFLFKPTRTYNKKLYFQPNPSKMAEISSNKFVGNLQVTIDTYESGSAFLKRAIRTLSNGLLRNFALALILIFLFHRFLTKPFLYLTQQFEKLDPEEPGKFRLKTPPSHETDEFSLLVDASNQMIQTIEANYDLLRTQARTLEETNEELIESKKRAEAANLAKSNFLAIMSHELRTPLNGVIGMAQMLRMGELTEEQDRACKTIVESGFSLNEILADILLYIRLEAGQYKVKPQMIELRAVARQITTLYASSALGKHLESKIEFDPSLSQIHMGDPVIIQQILTNLVSNAVKFTAEGSIGITIKLLEATAESERILISVSDTGIGIAEELQEDIFASFTQLDETSTRAYEGIGLGLAIVYKLVNLIGGEITLASLPGEGSTFSVTLTLDIAKANTPEGLAT